MAWQKWKKKTASFSEPRAKGCLQCKRPVKGRARYCYWCGKRRGLW